MFRSLDLPREIREELELATKITVHSNMNVFAVQYVTEDGTTKTYEYELPPGATEARLVRSSEVNKNGNITGMLGGAYYPNQIE